MFERFLDRLSHSDYRDKFVIKGGVLISAMVGIGARTTMDLDTTLRNLPLTKQEVEKAVRNICSISLADDVFFQFVSITSIRKDDPYGGYRVRLDAIYEGITTPLSIDVSTGDVITPEAVKYEFAGLIDDSVNISLWGYSIETILAEKTESILSRDFTNTRQKDFYDVYIFAHQGKYDPCTFHEALKTTAVHRGSWSKIQKAELILKQIEKSTVLQESWERYRRQFRYAADISFEDTIAALRTLLNS